MARTLSGWLARLPAQWPPSARASVQEPLLLSTTVAQYKENMNAHGYHVRPCTFPTLLF